MHLNRLTRCNILKAPQYVAFTGSKKQPAYPSCASVSGSTNWWWLLKCTISCYWLTLGLKIHFDDAKLLLGGQRVSKKLSDNHQIWQADWEITNILGTNQYGLFQWLVAPLHTSLTHKFVTKPTTASFSIATFSCYIPCYTTKVMWPNASHLSKWSKWSQIV